MDEVGECRASPKEEVPETAAPLPTTYNSSFFNLMVLSFSFLLIFTAFGTAQSFATPLLGDLGSVSLVLVYVFFSASGVVAPFIVRRLGARTALIWSSLCYAVFVGAFIFLVTPVLLVAAVLNGISGNVLWTAHGVLMTQISDDENKGRYFFLFQGIFTLQLIPGNIASHFLLGGGAGGGRNHRGNHTAATEAATRPDPLADMAVGWSSSDSGFFVVLTIACAVGVLGLLLLRRPPPKRPAATAAPVVGSTIIVPNDRPLGVQVRAVVALALTKPMLCLMPLFLFSGLQMVMWGSWFPRQIYKTQIGLVLPVVGAAAAVGGATIGPALDRFGHAPGMVLGCGCAAGALLCTWLGNERLATHCEEHAPAQAMPCEDFEDYAWFYAAAVLYGLQDCTFQSLCAVICSRSFASTGNTADAFSLRWSFFGVGATLGFVFSAPLSIEGGRTSSQGQLQAEIVIVLVTMAAALIGLGLFECTSNMPQVSRVEPIASSSFTELIPQGEADADPATPAPSSL